MPERKEARDRAQATVTAAAAEVKPPLTAGDHDSPLWVRVSPEHAQALAALAQGRSLDAVVADLIDAHLGRTSSVQQRG